MAIPSVVKFTKNGITYTGKCDIAKYSIQQLTQRALIDVGRYVIRQTRHNVILHWPIIGKGKSKRWRMRKNRYQYWFQRRELRLILGIENTKKGAVSAWWADRAEIGSGGMPKRGFLFQTVQESRDDIVRIEAQYLSYMNDEAIALGIISKEPEEDSEYGTS